MKTTAMLSMLITTAALAQTPAPVPMPRVADDAKAIDRVAEASRKDLPQDLLKRIVNEDIELLRGKRADGTYQYAAYDKMEAARVTESYSVDPSKKETIIEIRAQFPYRLVLSAPSRRMVVTRNKHVYVDRAEIEYIPLNDSAKKYQTSRIGAWIEPGTSKNVELNEIARQATVRVYTHADDSYGNLDLALIQAKVFDDPTSPYADAVASEKAMAKAIENNDIASIRAMAQRIAGTLQPSVAAVPAIPPRPATVDVIAPRADADVYGELQSIEDLLTGTDAEKRQGLDRLHQLVRKLRAASR